MIKSHGWREVEIPRVPGLHPSTKAWIKGGNRVLIAQEPRHGNDRLMWHLSISREDRYPGWDEIKDARYALLPLGLTFAMLLPPPGEYVNIHRNCFHLWEYDDTPAVLKVVAR